MHMMQGYLQSRLTKLLRFWNKLEEKLADRLNCTPSIGQVEARNKELFSVL